MSEIYILYTSNSSKYKICRINTKKYISRGFLDVPCEIYIETDKYQSIIPKWKFLLLIYVSVVLTEAVLWFFFQCFQNTDVFNMENDNLLDVRLKYMLFLLTDLIFQLPIVSYFVLPLLTNRILKNWCYKRTHVTNLNCIIKFIYEGFSTIEHFDITPILLYYNHILERSNKT